MDLLKKKKLKLLNPDLFKDWKNFSVKIRKQEFRYEMMELLQELAKLGNCNIILLDQDVRQFIASYTMINFDMFDKTSTKDLDLYYKTKELHENFELIFENNNKSLITIFFNSYTKYLDIFKQWKEHDEKIILDKSCTQLYKEVDEIEKKYDGDNPAEHQLSSSASQLKAKVAKRIRYIGGDRAMRYVNDSPKLKPIESMHLDMEDNMKKAFWDLFEEDVNKNNLEPICTNLDEFKKYLFELLGTTVRANTIREEFNQNVDIELIKQMVKNNSLNGAEIYNIMKLLTGYVQKYIQSASEDKDTELILENVYKMMYEQKESLGTVLRYYFQNMFQKLDKTKVQMELLKL